MLEKQLARYPASAPAVNMATDLLTCVRGYLDAADPLPTRVDLAGWWAPYQGPSAGFVKFMNARIHALTLLADLFASLRRIGLTVALEHPPSLD